MTETSSAANVREARMVAAFVEMADTLIDDYDIVDVLHRLVEHTVELIDCAAAGLMLTDQRGSMQVLASSTDGVRCWSCSRCSPTKAPAWTPIAPVNPSSSTTWPPWHNAGPPSPLKLSSRGSQCARRAAAATPRSHRRAQPVRPPYRPSARVRPAPRPALAHTATIGILQERAIRRGEVLTEQLQTALNNRITIEQAKGVLAHAGNLDMDQTFAVLRDYARHHSTRLSDIATQLANATLDPQTVLTHQPHHATSL